jgi:NADH-quinone oxidoreductase subunit C
MADDPQKPGEPLPTPPQAAGDKPPSQVPGEPFKGKVSRTQPSPGGQTPASAGQADAAGAAASAADAATAPKGAEATKPTPSGAEAAATPPPPAAKAAALDAEAAKTVSAAKAAPAAKAAAHAPPTAAPPSGPPDPPPPADKPAPAFIASLQAAVPGSVAHVSYWVGDWTIVVPVAQLLAAAGHLRDASDALFDFCSDVTVTDWPPRAEGRFDIVYCLYSTRLRHRIRVKVKAGDQQAVPSVTGIWPAANWLEREVYDMFGVNLTGHPDRRRILMPEDWQGFPQRKDYPLEGPGELLMENPLDWLRLRQARDEADIE